MENYGFDLRGQYFNFEIAPEAQLNLGQGVGLKNFCTVEVANHARLTVGRGVFFNSSCVLRCLQEVTIGEFTLFGDGVKIYDMNHKYSAYHVEALTFTTAPISVGKNCWIGANTVILKGVTIGENVIVGAGCVIHQDIPANSLVFNDGTGLQIRPRPRFDHHVLTFTASDTLEHLAYLAEALPEVAFHIVAGTHVSPFLDSFRRYNNVQLYTNVNDQALEDGFLDRTDIYLDINHWWETKDGVTKAALLGKPILAFEHTAKQPDKVSQLIPGDQPQAMVEAIRAILEQKEV